jgi:hypothetical protein
MDIQDFLSFVKAEFVGKKGWQVTFSEPSYDGYGYEASATIKTGGYLHEVFCTVDDDKSSDLSGQSVVLERGNPSDKCSDLPSGRLDGLTLARIVSAIAALETTSKPSAPAPRPKSPKAKIIERTVYVEVTKAAKRRIAAPKKPAADAPKPVALPGQFTLLPLFDALIGSPLPA